MEKVPAGRRDGELEEGEITPVSSQGAGGGVGSGAGGGRPRDGSGDAREPMDKGKRAQIDKGKWVSLDGLNKGKWAVLNKGRRVPVDGSGASDAAVTARLAWLAERQLKLSPHQEAAVRWMDRGWAAGAPGCVLADQTGLGKLVSVAAFLGGIMAELRSPRPCLVVVPNLAVLNDWHRVLTSWCRDMAVVVYAADASGGHSRAICAENEFYFRQDGAQKLAPMVQLDVLITTYDDLMRDGGQIEDVRRRIAWECLVLDMRQLNISRLKKRNWLAGIRRRHNVIVAESELPPPTQLDDLAMLLHILDESRAKSHTELLHYFEGKATKLNAATSTPATAGPLPPAPAATASTPYHADPATATGNPDASNGKTTRASEAVGDPVRDALADPVSPADLLLEELRPLTLRRLLREVNPDGPRRSERVVTVGMSARQCARYRSRLVDGTLLSLIKQLSQRVLRLAKLPEWLKLMENLRLVTSHASLGDHGIGAPRVGAASQHGGRPPSTLQEDSPKLALLEAMLKHLHAQGKRALVLLKANRLLTFVSEQLKSTFGDDAVTQVAESGGAMRYEPVSYFNDEDSPSFVLLWQAQNPSPIPLKRVHAVVVLESNIELAEDERVITAMVGLEEPVGVFRLVTEDSVDMGLVTAAVADDAGVARFKKSQAWKKQTPREQERLVDLLDSVLRCGAAELLDNTGPPPSTSKLQELLQPDNIATLVDAQLARAQRDKQAPAATASQPPPAADACRGPAPADTPMLDADTPAADGDTAMPDAATPRCGDKSADGGNWRSEMGAGDGDETMGRGATQGTKDKGGRKGRGLGSGGGGFSYALPEVLVWTCVLDGIMERPPGAQEGIAAEEPAEPSGEAEGDNETPEKASSGTPAPTAAQAATAQEGVTAAVGADGTCQARKADDGEGTSAQGGVMTEGGVAGEGNGAGKGDEVALPKADRVSRRVDRMVAWWQGRLDRELGSHPPQRGGAAGGGAGGGAGLPAGAGARAGGGGGADARAEGGRGAGAGARGSGGQGSKRGRPPGTLKDKNKLMRLDGAGHQRGVGVYGGGMAVGAGNAPAAVPGRPRQGPSAPPPTPPTGPAVRPSSSPSAPATSTAQRGSAAPSTARIHAPPPPEAPPRLPSAPRVPSGPLPELVAVGLASATEGATDGLESDDDDDVLGIGGFFSAGATTVAGGSEARVSLLPTSASPVVNVPVSATAGADGAPQTAAGAVAAAQGTSSTAAVVGSQTPASGASGPHAPTTVASSPQARAVGAAGPQASAAEAVHGAQTRAAPLARTQSLALDERQREQQVMINAVQRELGGTRPKWGMMAPPPSGGPLGEGVTQTASIAESVVAALGGEGANAAPSPPSLEGAAPNRTAVNAQGQPPPPMPAQSPVGAASLATMRVRDLGDLDRVQRLVGRVTWILGITVTREQTGLWADEGRRVVGELQHKGWIPDTALKHDDLIGLVLYAGKRCTPPLASEEVRHQYHEPISTIERLLSAPVHRDVPPVGGPSQTPDPGLPHNQASVPSQRRRVGMPGHDDANHVQQGTSPLVGGSHNHQDKGQRAEAAGEGGARQPIALPPPEPGTAAHAVSVFTNEFIHPLSGALPPSSGTTAKPNYVPISPRPAVHGALSGSVPVRRGSPCVTTTVGSSQAPRPQQGHVSSHGASIPPPHAAGSMRPVVNHGQPMGTSGVASRPLQSQHSAAHPASGATGGRLAHPRAPSTVAVHPAPRADDVSDDWEMRVSHIKRKRNMEVTRLVNEYNLEITAFANSAQARLLEQIKALDAKTNAELRDVNRVGRQRPLASVLGTYADMFSASLPTLPVQQPQFEQQAQRQASPHAGANVAGSVTGASRVVDNAHVGMAPHASTARAIVVDGSDTLPSVRGGPGGTRLLPLVDLGAVTLSDGVVASLDGANGGVAASDGGASLTGMGAASQTVLAQHNGGASMQQRVPLHGVQVGKGPDGAATQPHGGQHMAAPAVLGRITEPNNGATSAVDPVVPEASRPDAVDIIPQSSRDDDRGANTGLEAPAPLASVISAGGATMSDDIELAGDGIGGGGAEVVPLVSSGTATDFGALPISIPNTGLHNAVGRGVMTETMLKQGMDAHSDTSSDAEGDEVAAEVEKALEEALREDEAMARGQQAHEGVGQEVEETRAGTRGMIDASGTGLTAAANSAAGCSEGNIAINKETPLEGVVEGAPDANATRGIELVASLSSHLMEPLATAVTTMTIGANGPVEADQVTGAGGVFPSQLETDASIIDKGLGHDTASPRDEEQVPAADVRDGLREATSLVEGQEGDASRDAGVSRMGVPFEVDVVSERTTMPLTVIDVGDDRKGTQHLSSEDVEDARVEGKTQSRLNMGSPHDEDAPIPMLFEDQTSANAPGDDGNHDGGGAVSDTSNVTVGSHGELSGETPRDSPTSVNVDVRGSAEPTCDRGGIMMAPPGQEAVRVGVTTQAGTESEARMVLGDGALQVNSMVMTTCAGGEAKDDGASLGVSLANDEEDVVMASAEEFVDIMGGGDDDEARAEGETMPWESAPVDIGESFGGEVEDHAAATDLNAPSATNVFERETRLASSPVARSGNTVVPAESMYELVGGEEYVHKVLDADANEEVEID
eukprot:jgi/Mesvir1/14947/Mv25080-RA.1